MHAHQVTAQRAQGEAWGIILAMVFLMAGQSANAQELTTGWERRERELTTAGAALADGQRLVQQADTLEDPAEAFRLRGEAEEQFRVACRVFLSVQRELWQAWDNGDIAHDSPDAIQLRLAWYYWCSCLVERGRLAFGPTRRALLEKTIGQLNELIFEYDGLLVSFWARILKGDALTALGRYAEATIEYESILDLPERHPNWSPDTTATVRQLRSTAYDGLSKALAQRERRRSVNRNR